MLRRIGEIVNPEAATWSEFLSSLFDDDPTMDAGEYYQLIIVQGFIDVTKKAVQNRLKRVQDEQESSASDRRRAQVCSKFATVVYVGVRGATAVEGACQEVFDLITAEGLGVEGLRLIKQMAWDVFLSFQRETRPSPALRSRVAVWARMHYEINRYMWGASSDFTLKLLQDARSLTAQSDRKSKRK